MLGVVLLAWSRSALAGLLVTAAVTTVASVAVVLRCAGRRLEAMVADELGPSRSARPAPR